MSFQFILCLNISMGSLLERTRELLGQDSRSRNVNKNSVVILVCKVILMAVNFILLPITVGFVDAATYGVWITISSIVAWMQIFDLGMGNGLKNKYVESKAQGDIQKTQEYVSTTYAMLTFIFVPLILLFLIINPYINWDYILNVSIGENLNRVFAIVVAYFSFNFIFSTINIVLTADQRPGEAAICNVLQQVLVLLAIIVMTKVTEGSLTKLCITLCVIPLSVTILFNIILFSGRYKEVRPSLKSVRKNLVKDLLGLSIKFFMLQVVALILFQLTNFIIIHYYSPEDVTIYNVANRYFSLPQVFLAALTLPIWSAVTEAKIVNDYTWIRVSLKKYTLILFVFLAGELLMLLLAKPVYHIWMGNKIPEIPFLISLFCMLSASVSLSTSIYVNVLCGAGFLKLQMLFCIVSPMVFLALCFLFIKVLNFGVWCILFANLLANIYGLVIAPLQCYMVFYKNADGIWKA